MYNYYSVKVTKFKFDIFIQKGQIEEELRTDRGGQNTPPRIIENKKVLQMEKLTKAYSANTNSGHM